MQNQRFSIHSLTGFGIMPFLNITPEADGGKFSTAFSIFFTSYNLLILNAFAFELRRK